MSKIDYSLFSAHQHGLEAAYGQCPKCQANLHIRRGKTGAFLGCSQYPTCDFSKPVHEYESAIVKQIDGAKCPKCSGELAIKKGRYGFFVGCLSFPDCDFITNFLQKSDTQVPCPVCQKGELTERTNKFGKTFYSCSQYPKCKYVLNHAPVAKTCPECGWQVMQKKQTKAGEMVECPQKNCGAKIK